MCRLRVSSPFPKNEKFGGVHVLEIVSPMMSAALNVQALSAVEQTRLSSRSPVSELSF